MENPNEYLSARICNLDINLLFCYVVYLLYFVFYCFTLKYLYDFMFIYIRNIFMLKIYCFYNYAI